MAHRKVSYELLDCARYEHFLVGTDAAEIRDQDQVLVREGGGLRWHRCLRCDSWIPREPPQSPSRQAVPEREEIQLPLRGRLLRDRYVLRLISLDRAFHCVVLTVLAVAVFVFAADRSLLHRDFLRIVTALQGGVGGPVRTTHGSIERELTRLFAVSTRNLELTGLALSAYAVLEGVEAVGLWLTKRWAEYLTFVATVVLLPLEVYEISRKPTALKGLTLAINLAIAVYLVVAKRLFGIRGGHEAERRIREIDSGWPAIEAATPPALAAPEPS
ncbi:MAG TPA: DUF2127 domain-containing protein [Acidimicrobiales bacterium]|nr:DUF2127 domain-containing protein [Acidimicrobiales bacterium]